MLRLKPSITIIFLLVFVSLHVSTINASLMTKGRTENTLSSNNELKTSTIYDYLDNDNDKEMTRMELVLILNKAYGFKEKAQIGFEDIPNGGISREEVAKAVAAGYMLGYDNKTFGPDRKINNQEFASVVFRLLKLDRSPISKPTYMIRDLNDNPEWSKEIIYAVTQAGYMQTVDNCFNPKSAVGRKEAARVLDKLVGVIFNTSGNYGHEDSFETIGSNATINASGVNIKNKLLNGDLYISSGVGDGSVVLENVKVTGRTIICGGSNIVLSYKSKLGAIILEKHSGNNITLITEKDSKTGNISVLSAVTLEEKDVTGLAFGEVHIINGIKPTQRIILNGDFSTITSDAQDLKLFIGEKSMVGTINLNARTYLEGKGTIGTINVKAKDCTIEQIPGRMNIIE